jgi:hypothetical protein
LTLPSDPPPFSEQWWNLTDWFMQECKQCGMAISLSDYTLGIGQDWSVDKLLAANPDLNGFILQHESKLFQTGPVALEVGPVLEQTTATTRLRLPLSEKEMQIIVFTSGKPVLADQSVIGTPISRIELSGDWEFELKPSLDNR